ncbi:MAG: hypothetical protein ACLFR6_06615 [Salinarchaeum sp.]
MDGARRARIGAIILAVVVLLPAAGVVADSLTHQATEGVTYETNSGVEVSLGDDREVSATPFKDDETFNDSDLRISGSDASVEVDDDTYGSDPITIRNADVEDSLTVERTDLDRKFTIEDGDVTQLQARDFEVDNDEEDFAYSSDDGFTLKLDGQDSIGIAAVDADTGEPVDTVAVDEDGELELDLPSGQRSIRLESAPSELEVRDESNPDELIGDDENVTLRARLFSGEDEVVERQVENGTVSLDGVPLDEELIITVKEENADYTYRRILLDSAIETSEIYLLPTDEPSAEVRFQLQDDTDRFDAEDTKLFVEKPITRDNETEYRTISGDRLGADGQFPTILVDSERYRLRIENDEGEQRVLGSYTVQGAERTTLPIGEVEFSSDVSEGAALETSLREADDDADYDHEVRLKYLDPDARTDELDISIENDSGGEIRPSTTENVSGSESYVETYPIEDESFDPEEDTAEVTVDARYSDGETETFEETLGDVPDVFTDVPLNSDLMELMGLVSIVAVVGLLVIINPPLAALVGTGYAGLLTLVGIVSIPMPAVVLAGVVSVLATVGTNRGVLQ